MKTQRCMGCGARQANRYCDDPQCQAVRGSLSRLDAKAEAVPVVAGTEEDRRIWAHHEEQDAAADPVVMYGLLTESDVQELERRRAKLVRRQDAA